MSFFASDAKNIDDMDHIGFYLTKEAVKFRECEFRGLTSEDRQKLVDQLNTAIAPIKASWCETLKERLKNKL